MSFAFDMTGIPDNVPAGAVVDFDVYNPPGLQKGFYEAWKTLQADGIPPLVWTPRNGGHWIATRGTEIAKFLGDPVHFSSRIIQVPRERAIGNTPIPGSIDPPDHGQYRAAVNVPMSPRAVGELHDDIRALTIELIDRFRGVGHCDFITEFALELPLKIFLNYAAIPLSDLPKLRGLAEEMVRPTGAMSAGDVMVAMADYLRPLVEHRLANPEGQDLLTKVYSGKIHGRPMTVDEGIRYSSNLIFAGLDTVAGILSFTFHYLALNPSVRQQLLDDRSLIPVAVEEFLRRFPLVAIARELNCDYEHDGILLRERDIIVLPTMLHGLDETFAANPLDVDFERAAKLNSTFGQGNHRCPGAFLARAELKIVLEEWLPRIPTFTVRNPSKIGYRSGVVGAITGLELQWPAG